MGISFDFLPGNWRFFENLLNCKLQLSSRFYHSKLPNFHLCLIDIVYPDLFSTILFLLRPLVLFEHLRSICMSIHRMLWNSSIMFSSSTRPHRSSVTEQSLSKVKHNQNSE